MIFDQDVKPPLDAETLEHFGVKGMHWGVRSAAKTAWVGKPDAAGVTRQDKRIAVRQVRRETRRTERDFAGKSLGRARDKEIKAARAKLDKANDEYRTSKRAIKSQRETMGKNAAKIALKEAKHKNYRVYSKAHEETTGEMAFRAAVEVGLHVSRSIAEKKRETAARESTQS